MKPPYDQHVLTPQGPQAAHIEQLWWFYLTVAIVVCVLVWAFVLIALMRRDAVRNGDDSPRLDEETLRDAAHAHASLRSLDAKAERRRTGWVLGFTGATVLVLFALLNQSVATGSLLNNLPEKDPVHIQLTGHRWWWSARYYDPSPSKIFVTANELHIPVGRTVILKLTSADVIHSFWVPNLHGKRDLVPGIETTLSLRADKAGIYRGQCAEFCGHSHAQMALLVIAEDNKKFERWRSKQAEEAPSPQTAEQRRGQEVFLSSPCVTCHAISGTIAQSNAGPDLSHLASRSTLAAGALPNTRGHLAGWLLNAPQIKPGTQMPRLTLPSQDLHALIAYLESLQ